MTSLKFNINQDKESTTSSESEDYKEYDEQYNPEIQARVPKLTEEEKREVLKRILKDNPVVCVCRNEKEFHAYLTKVCRV